MLITSVISILRLRYFDKLTNFFATAYTNSPKYNSSFLSHLRVFFERNNKFKSTFASLGNTFRNSKWTDLKVQNIKTPLISNWFSWALCLFFASLLLLSFFGNSYLNSFFINVPFITDALDGVFYIWAHFINILSLSWIQLWLAAVSFKFTILNFLGFNQNYLYKAFNDTHITITKKTSLPTNLKKLKLTPYAFYDNESLSLVYYLSRVNKSLSYLKQQNFMQQKYKSYNMSLMGNIHDLLLESTVLQESNNVRFNFKELNSYIYNYELENNASLHWSNYFTPTAYTMSLLSGPQFYTINLNSLQNLNNTKFSSVLNNLNVYSNLNQSKQDRWFMKNSILSNSSTVDLNAFTQAKKLVSVNLLDSSNTSSNIWNSSKMTQLTKASELQKLSLLQNFIGLNTTFGSNNELKSINELSAGLEGFNYFESSSLWTTKKYFFTNQLKLNTVLVNTIKANQLQPQVTDTFSAFNLISNLHNSNINLQLNELNNLTNTSATNTFGLGVSDLNQNIFIQSEDIDLLNSFNLDIINNLTSPIIEKNTTISDYTIVHPFFKKQIINYKN